ncbi:hypothetical protein E4U09_004720 [Claviceps aff. purpurea]|uniref:Uncharacterized protein n=1 Tax=Claviceps aff. purpurea TaxID=1967640 RepID=A0A9P7U157_9HYPO|nr:hypothetical protein E4U09_004720 [Claviceps aff. purpurea]
MAGWLRFSTGRGGTENIKTKFNPYPQFSLSLSLSLSHTHTHTRTHTHTDTSLFIPFKYFTSSNYSSRDQEK